jgi:hypothetical protein
MIRKHFWRASLVWPGRGYRIGAHVIRNAADMAFRGVPMPASPAALDLWPGPPPSPSPSLTALRPLDRPPAMPRRGWPRLRQLGARPCRPRRRCPGLQRGGFRAQEARTRPCGVGSTRCACTSCLHSTNMHRPLTIAWPSSTTSATFRARPPTNLVATWLPRTTSPHGTRRNQTEQDKDRNLAEGLQVGAASRVSDSLLPSSIPVPPTS